MRNLDWTVLIWGLPIAAIVSLIYESGYAYGHDAGYAAGVQVSINKTTQPALTQKELDKTCAAWLFDTNQKEAKQRICSKK